MITSKIDCIEFFLNNFIVKKGIQVTPKIKTLIIKDLETNFNFEKYTKLDDIERNLNKELNQYFLEITTRNIDSTRNPKCI